MSSPQGSRLTQIQMRYQQKVMHETAQKKSDMYGGGGYEDPQKLLTSSLGAGKVRAMFDERRNRAGIDKSYLLEPIAVESNRTTNGKRQVIGPAKAAPRDQRITNYSKVIVPPLQNRTANNHHDINGNNYYKNATDDPFDRTQRPGENPGITFKKKPAVKASTTSTGVNTKKPSPPAVTTVLSPSPPLKNVHSQKPQQNASRTMKSGNSASSSGSVRSMPGNALKTATNGNSVAMQPTVTKPSSAQSQKSQESFDEVDDGPVPEGLAKCSICKRNFAEDRLEKHQTICQKTKTKKRKVYDASKKRVQGTEAESYLRKPATSARNAPKAVKATPNKNSSWRAQHEDFVKTIRAAKEMQAYVAKGGKLSDLPPPPPSQNLDYVQCPHCSRRFNESAAARHIPICTSINKPKAKASGGVTTKTNSFAKRR